LRRFVLRRFTFTTLVESDRTIPTCGASLSQLKRPFSTCALLDLFRCTCVSYFSVLVQLFWVDCDFSTHDVHQKERKQEKIKTFDVTFSLDIFWTTAWAFFNKIKSDLIDIFSIICVIFYMSSSLT